MANVVFTQALLGATSTADPHDVSHIALNFIAASLFLKDPSFNLTLYPNGVPVLDLDTIQDKLNLYIGSASKAYTDGYYPEDGSLLVAAPVRVQVDAQGEKQRLALVTSKPIWGVTMVCTISAGLLLGVLWMGIGEGREREPLDLESMLRALQTSRLLDEDTGRISTSLRVPPHRLASKHYSDVYQNLR
jgi:hypothetical protein